MRLTAQLFCGDLDSNLDEAVADGGRGSQAVQWPLLLQVTKNHKATGHLLLKPVRRALL